jgi:hypothetical protein
VLLTILIDCGSPSGAASQPTAPAVAPSATATQTTAPALPCPTGSPSLANIQSGGEGAILDTFAARWGPPGGVAAGNLAFGRYPDTGRQKVLVPSYLPANNRVWTVQYFVDTTQQLRLDDAAAIATSILPQDATQRGEPRQNGDGVTVAYCSAAMLAAFPPGTSMNGQPMPDTGFLTVGYILRADGFVDSVVVGYGCVDAAVCSRG